MKSVKEILDSWPLRRSQQENYGFLQWLIDELNNSCNHSMIFCSVFSVSYLMMGLSIRKPHSSVAKRKLLKAAVLLVMT